MCQISRLQAYKKDNKIATQVWRIYKDYCNSTRNGAPLRAYSNICNVITALKNIFPAELLNIFHRWTKWMHNPIFCSYTFNNQDYSTENITLLSLYVVFKPKLVLDKNQSLKKINNHMGKQHF